MNQGPRTPLNGWLKYVVTTFGGLFILGLIAASAANQQIKETGQRVDKIETRQDRLEQQFKQQAETNGRIDERTQRILEEIAALRQSIHR